jgi:glutamate synthase (ferredoxin)
VNAVVEAVGDHGCEYMTGGRVVVIGPTGRNFAAGMSGGIAYVLDAAGDFAGHCNKQMVELEKLTGEAEIQEVKAMIEKHVQYTGSDLGKQILNLWNEMVPKFVKIIPKDYKRVLESLERVKSSGLTGEEAIMAAFEANVRDLSCIGGN